MSYEGCGDLPHCSAVSVLFKSTLSHKDGRKADTLSDSLASVLCLTGKKKGGKTASPSSLAFPGRSAGSGSTSQGRGTKQAGRRRSRESKQDVSVGVGSDDEEVDEPSAKR